MINPKDTTSVSQPSPRLPGSVIILCTVLMVFFYHLTRQQPSTPPLLPSKSVESLDSELQWKAVLDPSGYERSLARFPQLFSLDSSGKGALVLGNPPKVLQAEGGAPRAAFKYRGDAFQAQAELYDCSGATYLVSGPIKLTVTSDLIKKNTEGLSLDALRKLPSDTEKVVWLDTEIINLPESHRAALRKEWAQWEFQPLEALGAAFRSPFCYSVWHKKSYFLFGMESQQRMESELQRRFPKVVIRMTSAWAAGGQIAGFGKEENAAWAYRGDYLMTTPEGGVEGLSRFLEARYGTVSVAQGSSAFMQEFARLSTLDQRGWHVAIIERSSGSSFHWALLLRFKDKNSANGYLIIEPKPTDLTEQETDL